MEPESHARPSLMTSERHVAQQLNAPFEGESVFNAGTPIRRQAKSRRDERIAPRSCASVVPDGTPRRVAFVPGVETLYLFSLVGTSRCIGPRTVPVRSGLSGAQTANFY